MARKIDGTKYGQPYYSVLRPCRGRAWGPSPGWDITLRRQSPRDGCRLASRRVSALREGIVTVLKVRSTTTIIASTASWTHLGMFARLELYSSASRQWPSRESSLMVECWHDESQPG